MKSELLSTHQKALQINLDQSKYGTFAEIGAGQEVARRFFHAGGAAGTIAKTISAYDMVVSDAIYGHSDRYVSRQRLQMMLDYEHNLLITRLDDHRGATTKFFVFADTVAARSYKGTGECHGWMGLRFQTAPHSPASQIIIHVRMLDLENIQQQEALGIVGVNLVYGALYLHEDPEALMLSLRDNLAPERLEVDMIKFSGPAFAHVDNRLISLKLVQHWLAEAAMFTADGEVVQASEVLHKKPILVERGSFRPVTHVTMDVLECGRRQFFADMGSEASEVVVLMEMTLRNLTDPRGGIDYRDFLDRVDILGTLGQTVLISNYARYFKLATYLSRYTKKRIGIALGMPSLKEIFDPGYYTDLEGGIMEGFGKLFKNDLKLYVYPRLDPITNAQVTVANFIPPPALRHLYAHLLENGCLKALEGIKEERLPIYSKQVLMKIQANDPSWETMVPPQVAQMIKERKLFGYGVSQIQK